VRELKDIIFFPLVCGIVNVIFFTLLSFIFYGRLPEFSAFSFTMSISLAVVGTLSSLVGILIMKHGKVSVYSVFMMLGGMILPYFYGLYFLDENISAARIIGLLILICALPCSVISPEKSAKKNKPLNFFYILCICIFFLNGATSIISKTHSINISAVPAANFIVYANLWTVIINSTAYFILSRRLKKNKTQEVNIQNIQNKNIQKMKKNKFHAVLTASVFAAIAGLGFLFQLVTAKTIPAVVLYPFVTGGTIVLSSVGAVLFFKEKISKLAIAGIIMSLCGTLLFII
jgi:multidrug transporter EmrE-like cation transporter